MSKFKTYLDYLLSMPKSIWFCFTNFPFMVAIKVPVFIANNVFIRCNKGKIKINAEKVRTGLIKIGFGDVGIFDKARSRSIYENNGTIVFSGGDIRGSWF